MKRVMLITKAIARKLPLLRGQDGLGDAAIVYAKFFTPDSDMTWLVLEYDPETRFLFTFGGHIADPINAEYGYTSLDELEAARGKLGLPIERDRSFEPMRIDEAKRQEFGL